MFFTFFTLVFNGKNQAQTGKSIICVARSLVTNVSIYLFLFIFIIKNLLYSICEFFRAAKTLLKVIKIHLFTIMLVFIVNVVQAV